MNNVNDRYRAIADKYAPRLDTPERCCLNPAEAHELLKAFISLQNRFERIVKISDVYQMRVKTLLAHLQESMASVKTLSGCLPICASCKKIRNESGAWRQLEEYLSDHSEALFSHGICPDCLGKLYGIDSGGTPTPAQQISEADMDDAVIVKHLPTITTPHLEDNPLHGEFKALFSQYVRLSKRMKRIARISDGYQTQLRQLTAELDHACRTDLLTGLPNRRDVTERLQTEQSRAGRYGSPFSVIMIDIDNFKLINDRHGHDAGDRVLQDIARILNDVLRSEDCCARWGGEEFLVLLPATACTGAFEAAEKLRRRIADERIAVDREVVMITASLGVTAYRTGESLDVCLKRADNALQQAKRGGKDRTVLMEAEDVDAAGKGSALS